MKKVLIILAMLLSQQAFSTTTIANETCAYNYRTGALKLIELMESLNSYSITLQEAGVLTAALSAQTATLSSACFFASAVAVSCSEKYNSVYTSLRSQIRALALITGNQTTIESGILDQTAAKLRIKFIDLSCF